MADAPTAPQMPGLAQAMAACGRPIERLVAYRVSKDTLLYWQAVLRRRPGEVVLVLRRHNGRYLVHTKEFYPPGTYRLMTGGIKPGEDLLQAVRREAHEETGLQVSIDRFLAIIHHRFHRGEQTVPFTSCLFLVGEQGRPQEGLSPSDREERISDYRETDLDGFLRLAEELESLPLEWRDWGRFRASAHRVAWETLRGDDGLHG